MIAFLMLGAMAVMQPHQHGTHGPHSAPAVAQESAGPGAMVPRETGQSAFAAVAETVAILTADAATDWSKVRIDALRAHLVDMDNVTLRARVISDPLPGGARFRVTGTGDTIGSIQRLTRSHFTGENVRRGWAAASETTRGGAVVTVTSAKRAEAKRIQALGFFGILADGAHHQPHHLMIARGMHH